MKIVTQGKTLAFYTKRSLAIHCCVLILGLAVGKLGLESISKNRDLNLKIIESSVRVDVVGMPKMTLRQLRQLPRVDQSAESLKTLETEASKETSSVEFQRSSKGKNFASMLKGLSTRKIEKAPKKKKEKASSQNTRALEELVLAGNKVFSGTALSGNYGEAQGSLETYLGSLPDRVRVHWFLPSYLAQRDLTCRIRIYLDSEGKLLRAIVQESSGNSEYDTIALEAVKKTTFPKPDKGFSKEILKGNILLGFPL